MGRGSKSTWRKEAKVPTIVSKTPRSSEEPLKTPSDSREDDPRLEGNTQEYHRARQKQTAGESKDRVRNAEGRIAQEMNDKTQALSRGKPRSS
jgi:hypothetical protein